MAKSGCVYLLSSFIAPCKPVLLVVGSTRPTAYLAGMVVQIGAGGQRALTVPVLRLPLLELVGVACPRCSLLITAVQLCLQLQTPSAGTVCGCYMTCQRFKSPASCSADVCFTCFILLTSASSTSHMLLAFALIQLLFL